jgi:hypothetical protein
MIIERTAEVTIDYDVFPVTVIGEYFTGHEMRVWGRAEDNEEGEGATFEPHDVFLGDAEITGTLSQKQLDEIERYVVENYEAQDNN